MRWRGVVSRTAHRWRSGALILTAVLAVAAPQVMEGSGAPGYERQPVLQASDLAPPE
jgi:hypothetical protein